MSPIRTGPTTRCLKLARIIAALDSLHLDDGTDAFPPSNLEFTGIDTPTHASNVIPGSATAQLNIRFNDLHKGADLVRTVEEIAAAKPREQRSGANLGRGLPHPARPALRCRRRGNPRRKRAFEPELSTSGGTSDGRFLIQLCPVVDFGLPNATMHKVGEHAAVEDIRALSRIYQRIVENVVG
jgi:succinyl-diaminopimelate desuccinylase